MRPAGNVALLPFGAGVLYAGFLAAAALPDWRMPLWGANAWTYLPPFLNLGFLLAAAAWTLLVNVAPPFPRRWTALLGSALLAALLFYLLRDRTHLLGDGRLWVSVLGNQRAHHPHEPLAFAASLLATMGLAKSAPGPVAARAELLSVGLGSLAVVLMLLLAASLAKDNGGRWTAFGLMIGMGILQFGFGYVEAYPAFWVSVLLYLVLAWNVLEGRRSLAWAGLALGLAAAVHGLGFLLFPSFVVVLAARRRSGRELATTAVAILAPLLAGYVGLSLILPSGSSSSSEPHFNPKSWNRLFREIEFYDRGPGAWALGQLNRWLLAGGSVVLLLAARVAIIGKSPPARKEKLQGKSESLARTASAKPSKPRDLGNLFLLVASAALVGPALVLDLEASRGAAVDWDAYSVAAVPLMALAARLWLPFTESPAVRRGLAFTAAIGLFGALAFIGVNALPTQAVQRFSGLADHVVKTPRARSWAFESLAVYNRNKGDMKSAADFYLKSIEHQKSNARLLFNGASALMQTKRYSEASPLWRQLAEVDPGNSSAWFGLGASLEQSGSPDSAMAAYRKALKTRPDYVEAMNYLARLLVRSPEGRLEAYGLLQRSLQVAPNNPGAGWARSTLEKLAPRRKLESPPLQ